MKPLDEPVSVTGQDGTQIQVLLPQSMGALSLDSETGAAVSDTVDNVSTVVVPNEDTSLTIATVLENENAGDAFSYVYPGLSLTVTEGGDVLGYDADQNPAATIALPWAIDKTGQDVPTRYEASGDTLTQIVEHKGGDYSYPIVADPTSWGGNFMYSSIVSSAVSQGVIVSVYPAPIKFPNYSNATIWANYTALVPAQFEQNKFRDQLLCHVWNAGQLKTPWNLDSRRPDVGYAATVAQLCCPDWS